MSVSRQARVQVASPVAAPLSTEPLVPREAAWLYLLTPPFLTLLFDANALSGDFSTFPRNLASTWIHAICIGGLIHLFYLRLVPRLLAGAHSAAGRLAVHGGAVGVGVAGGLLAAFPLAALVCDGSSRHLAHELYTAAFTASIVVAVMMTYQSLRRRAHAVELRAERARQAAIQAELSGLQARTDPHFLFNSLNTVAGLIAEDPARAEQTVERLAGMFRYTLDASRRSRVSVRREAAAVRDYFEIESIRVGKRLRWSLDVAPEAEAVLVPPLLLLPLVENAIRHGVSQNRAGGRVRITATVAADRLRVVVTDDGPGPGRSRHRGSQTSVRELRERLAIVYGEAASLQISGAEEGGCRVELSLPVTLP
jgi:hypothetical protein